MNQHIYQFGLTLGFKPNNIKVNPFGFQIHFKVNTEDYNKKIKKGNELCVKKIVIALAGPAVNLIIAIICLLISMYYTNIAIIVYTNLLLAIFNLLPIYPLDGGRILQEIVNIQKGKQEAYRITNSVSKITIIILTAIVSIVILYIHNIAFILILIYLWFLVIKNEKEYIIKNKIYEQVNL